VKVINREFKNYKKEAEIQNEIFFIDGYSVEEIHQIAQYMVKLIEPAVNKVRERRERLSKTNSIINYA